MTHHCISPLPSPLPVSPGQIRAISVQVGRMVSPDWCQKGDLLRMTPPEWFLPALFWALVGTATYSSELDVNWSQPCLVMWLLSSLCVCVQSLSCVRLFATPWTAARQVPRSMECSRQEYWSGWPFPALGDLPDPGIELMSPVALALVGRFFTTE